MTDRSDWRPEEAGYLALVTFLVLLATLPFAMLLLSWLGVPLG